MNGKRILITGASGGIGRALLTELAGKGAALYAVGRNEQRLQQLLASLPANADGPHRAVAADLTTVEGRQRIVDEAEKFGANVLINLAGSNNFSLLGEQSEQTIEQMINTNLTGQILLTRALLPQLLLEPDSQILMVGSTLGSIGYPGYAVYCATKFALRGFSEALARELADTELRVKYLAPRATATELNSDAVNEMNQKLGNAVDSPALVAEQICRFLNEPASSRYLGWPEKLFVKINALLPDMVSRSIGKQLPIIKHYLTSHE